MTYRRRVTSYELTAMAVPLLQAGLGLPLVIAAAYCLKSALGIDLMDGPSPLHAWLYWR